MVKGKIRVTDFTFCHEYLLNISKGQILRSTSNTAPLICGVYNIQREAFLTMA